MRRQEEIQRLIAQGVVSYLLCYNGMDALLCTLLVAVMYITLFLYTFASLCCYCLTAIREVALVAACMLLLRSSLPSHYPLLNSPDAIISQIRLGFITSFHYTKDGCLLGYDAT
jgi:hypothetical protein